MQQRNHFLKIINKLTKKAMDKAVEKVHKDATEKVGKKKADEIISGLKTKMETDKKFKKGVKRVNTTGKIALVTSAILGAAAAAGVGAGAGAAGAGTGTGTGTAAAGVGLAGTGAEVLSKKGEVPGDQDKKIIDQLLDSKILEEKSSELLNRIVNGDEDTGRPSMNNEIIDNDNEDKKRLGLFPVDDTIFIFVIIAIIVLLLMTKRK